MDSDLEIESCIRGFHVYKDRWNPVLGENLSCQRELSNGHDLFAVAVLKNGTIIRHLPRKISSICSLFISKGGSLTCRVSSSHRYSADLPQGGLEIPCVLLFQHDDEKLM